MLFKHLYNQILMVDSAFECEVVSQPDTGVIWQVRVHGPDRIRRGQHHPGGRVRGHGQGAPQARTQTQQSHGPGHQGEERVSATFFVTYLEILQ